MLLSKLKIYWSKYSLTYLTGNRDLHLLPHHILSHRVITCNTVVFHLCKNHELKWKTALTHCCLGFYKMGLGKLCRPRSKAAVCSSLSGPTLSGQTPLLLELCSISWACQNHSVSINLNTCTSTFYAPPQKVAGYYVIPSELLSVCLSVRPSVCPSVRQRLNIHVRSITLIPFEIISRNLVQILTMIRRRAEINNCHSTYIFCGIIPLCNFQYRNRVRSITLILFEIISQNLVEI